MSNLLIIIRGLPGSGKTTLASCLSENGKYPVYGIDDYFVNEKGEYHFNFQDNHKAYSSCQINVEAAMIAQESKIFIDNVFSLEWEIEPYFELAKKHNYQVHVLTSENRHQGKNIHGVDDEQIEKMAAKFKVVLK